MWITKKQFRGAWFLGILIVLTAAANQWIGGYFSIQNQKLESPADSITLDSLLAEIHIRQLADKEYFKKEFEFKAGFKKAEKSDSPIQVHDFDPNTVTRADWLAMNLPEKVFNGLEKYRAKGGRIRKPEGILKLYNLDPAIAQQMLPFVKLDSSQFAKPKFEFKKSPPFPEKPKYKPFDLNEADTTQLMAVYGIGRGIANRIVRHRNGLGGFMNKSQVYEVFAIDSAVVEELFIKAYLPENPNIRKLNINLATEEDLAKNPYIRKGFARIIVKYRTQHGPFKKAEDLLEIKILKQDLVDKLRAYLEF